MMPTTVSTKILFALSPTTVKTLKQTVPARKRSQLIEELLINYFTEKKQAHGWQAVERLKKSYAKKRDPIAESAVQWLHKDRRSH